MSMDARMIRHAFATVVVWTLFLNLTSAASLRGTNFLVTAPDLLDYLRAAFSPHSELPFDRRFDEVRTAALLVIDHLDTSSATPWAREKLRQIVEYRYLTRLPTVFTTVETLDQIDPVVRSRLLDRRRSLIFAILAPDYRGGEAPPRPPHGRR